MYRDRKAMVYAGREVLIKTMVYAQSCFKGP